MITTLAGGLMAKLPTLAANSFDACFCDPHDGLTSEPAQRRALAATVGPGGGARAA